MKCSDAFVSPTLPVVDVRTSYQRDSDNNTPFAFSTEAGTFGVVPLFAKVKGDDNDNEISSMRIGVLKKELELLGISTKTMLEKKELVEALTKARAEGRQPAEKASSPDTSDDGDKSHKKSREERIAEEIVKVKDIMEKCSIIL